MKLSLNNKFFSSSHWEQKSQKLHHDKIMSKVFTKKSK